VQRRGGITTFLDAEDFENFQEQRRFQQRQDDKHSKKASKSGAAASTAAPSQRNERARNRLADEDDVKGAGLGELGLGVDTKKQAAFEIKSMYGVDLLSKFETSLCTSQRLAPAEYINAKDTLIREYLRLGYVRVERAKLICPSVDPAKIARVYEEIVKAGWIRPNPPSSALK